MTETSALTVRTWSATATSAGAGDYHRYFAGTLLSRLRELTSFDRTAAHRSVLVDARD